MIHGADRGEREQLWARLAENVGGQVRIRPRATINRDQVGR
jgi:hypothetical protein